MLYIPEEAILGSFQLYLTYLWKQLNLPKPTRIQLAMAEWLQYGPSRLILEAFRGSGKSWVAAAYSTFELKNNRNERVLVTSASKPRADDFSTFVQQLINQIPLLGDLKPAKDQRQSKISFDVGGAPPAQAPSMKSVGIFGQTTGSRATICIGDDNEIPNNSATEDQRMKLLKAVLEFESIVVPDVGKIRILGTPQTQNSIYNKLRERGYACRIWPAEYPRPETAEKIYQGCLDPVLESEVDIDPKLAGTPTEPLRFDAADLLKRRAMGAAEYSLQFLLDTTLSDVNKYPLKLSNLLVIDVGPKAPLSCNWGSGAECKLQYPNIGMNGDYLCRPWHVDTEWMEFQDIVMGIDPAGRGADELAYAIVGYLNGYCWVLASGGMMGGYSDNNLLHLATKCLLHGVKRVFVEDNFGDGMFTKLLTPVLHKMTKVSVEEVHATGQKETRILHTLEPLLERHRLGMTPSVVQSDLNFALEGATGEEYGITKMNYSLLYQLSHLTRDRRSLKHDDRLDALEIACNAFTQNMGIDPGKGRSGITDKWLRNATRDFVKHCLKLPSRHSV